MRNKRTKKAESLEAVTHTHTHTHLYSRPTEKNGVLPRKRE